MGNTQEPRTQKGVFDRRYHHSVLGFLSLYSQGPTRFAEKELTLSQQEEHKFARLQRLYQTLQDNYAFLPTQILDAQAGQCWSLGPKKLTLRFPFSSQSLEEQIYSKKHSQDVYSDKQLLYFLLRAGEALLALHRTGQAHLNLRPEVFVIRNGQYWLVPSFLLNFPEGSFFSYLVHKPEGLISPAQMLSVKLQDSYPRHIPQKSDVFCLGLVAFQMMTQGRVDHLFSLTEKRIYLTELHSAVPPGPLGQLVLGMLLQREKDRFSMQQVCETAINLISKL